MDKDSKKRLREEKARVAKAQAAKLKELEKEDKIRVKFQNLEFPNTPLQFNFQSIKNYLLYDGVEYELPVSVIDHLNSLAIPIYKMYDPEEEKTHFNPEPKDPNERIIGSRNRFSLIPVTVRNIAPKKEPPAKEKAA